MRNAPATFQRFIDIVTQGLQHVRAYIDDIIVYSDSEEEHVQHLSALFERLQAYGVTMNLQKSSFFVTNTDFLGFNISASGYKPVKTFVPKVENFPTPKTRKDVQKFLGVVNYYRSHLPDLANIAGPLYELLRLHQRFSWTEVQ